MIRENPSKYWKYIAQPFRRQFTKKVLIMGSASNGKTTLAKDLARYYDAPVSLEYAREYQIKNNVRDDELTPKDYYYLLLGQYDQTSKLIDSNANRGLVIADTNSLVTKGYYDYIWRLRTKGIYQERLLIISLPRSWLRKKWGLDSLCATCRFLCQ